MLSSYINQSFSNLLINGGDGKSQKYGSDIAFTVGIGQSVVSIHGADKWQLGGGAAFALGDMLYTDPIGGPGIALSGRPVGRVQRYEVGTTEVAPAASQIKVISQAIEGSITHAAGAQGKKIFKSIYLNATPGKTLTFFFQVKPDGVTPTHSYVIPFTTVSGWTRYAFEIPEAPATLHTGTETGLVYGISFHTGSDFETSTTNAWTAGAFVKATGESNFMDTAGNFIEIDQAQVLVGERFSTDFINSAKWVPHSKVAGGELKAMQRYYEHSGDPHVANLAFGTSVNIPCNQSVTNGDIFATSFFATPKRAIPVALSYDGHFKALNRVGSQSIQQGVNSGFVSGTNEHGFSLLNISGVALNMQTSTGRAMAFTHWEATANI